MRKTRTTEYGQILEGAKKYNLLTKAEEIELARNQQYELLALHNQRLIILVAKKHIGKGLSLPALFQEGYIGLMTGARKFDPTKGYKFSTYAFNWINQAMTRAIANQSANIRIPVYMHERFQKIRKAAHRLSLKGVEITSEAIAQESGLKIKEVKDAYAAMGIKSVSGNKKISDDPDGAELLDMFPSDQTNSLEALDVSLGREQLRQALDQLPEAVKVAIEYRYGIRGGKALSCAKIAKAMQGDGFKLSSHETARSMVKRGEAKLRKIFRVAEVAA